MGTEPKHGTLGYHLAMTKLLLGEDSAAVSFLNEQIDKAPHGADEEVVADESQVVALLVSIHNRGRANHG